MRNSKKPIDQNHLLYLPTQTRFPTGRERGTCRGSKLPNSLGQTKLANSLGKQQLELSTRTLFLAFLTFFHATFFLARLDFPPAPTNCPRVSDDALGPIIKCLLKARVIEDANQKSDSPTWKYWQNSQLHFLKHLKVTVFKLFNSFFFVKLRPRPHVSGYFLQSVTSSFRICRMRVDGKKKLRFQTYPDTCGRSELA